MKKLIIVIVAIGFFFTSCETDSISGTPSYSDVTWYASTPLKVNAAAQIVAGKAISVYDLSQGTLSHEWKISQGTSFLTAGFKNGGAGTGINPDLTPFIDTTKGLSSTDSTVFILFPTVGNYTITLKNTFKDKVTYKGTVPVDAVLVNGVWVFEQVFNITVI